MVAIDEDMLQRIASQRRFGLQTLEIARRLFLHHEAPADLALAYGLRLQRVYAIRKSFETAARRLQLPPGWIRMELAGPAPLVRRYRRMFDAALVRWQTMHPVQAVNR